MRSFSTKRKMLRGIVQSQVWSHSVTWCVKQVGSDEGSRSTENAHQWHGPSRAPPCPAFLCCRPPSLAHIIFLSLCPQPEMLSPSCDLQVSLGSSAGTSLFVKSARIHLMPQNHPRRLAQCLDGDLVHGILGNCYTCHSRIVGPEYQHLWPSQEDRHSGLWSEPLDQVFLGALANLY